MNLKYRYLINHFQVLRLSDYCRFQLKNHSISGVAKGCNILPELCSQAIDGIMKRLNIRLTEQVESAPLFQINPSYPDPALGVFTEKHRTVAAISSALAFRIPKY